MSTQTCDEHSRHQAGCGDCQARSAAKERGRSRAIAYGTWRGLQDPAPARAHVLTLHARHRMSGTRIADKAGVARSVVHQLIAGTRKAMQPRVYDAVLAVEPDLAVVSDTNLVPSIGVARRLQALAARGHGLPKLAAELGVGVNEVSRWRRGHRPSIVAGTDRAVRDMYRKLALLDGGDEKTYAVAHAEGWAPPAAWDSDDDLDDPCAQPDMTVVRDPICEVLEGRRTADSLSPNDRLRAVQYLIALHYTDRQIHARLRWPGTIGAVTGYRTRLGLKPGSYRGEPKEAAKRARERRRNTFLQMAPAEISAAIDRFDFDSEPIALVVQAIGCTVSTVESRRAARARVRDAEADPVMVRRAVTGEIRFGALNEAEKLLLFATHGNTMTLTGMLRTLRISVGTHQEWMRRVAASAEVAA